MTEKFAPVDKILKEHGCDPAQLIPILQQVQDLYRYLPEDVMRHIADKLEISPARVFGVATFFAHFAITPKGKHIIRVCNGTACHVKGSSFVINTVKDKLKLKDGQGHHRGRSVYAGMRFVPGCVRAGARDGY